nr:uncharacterized protein LOC109185392 [Ipomoea trifida]
MKFSMKFQDSQQKEAYETRWPLLFRAKIPISIFNRPFLCGFSTTSLQPSDDDDFSVFLATNFSSGSTLKLAYTYNGSATSPLTLTLKSGLGLKGSPINSPFIISANYSIYPHNPHYTPTLSFILKPQLGPFSLKAPSCSNPKGISVRARTEVPVSKKFLINCRWGVNFPEDLGTQMPHLSLNKIEIEMVDVVKEKKEKRELDTVQRENREMKLKLEEFKTGNSQLKLEELKTGSSQGNPGGDIMEKKEVKKNGVESELEKPTKSKSGFFFSPE